jgi:hypothetical protein
MKPVELMKPAASEDASLSAVPPTVVPIAAGLSVSHAGQRIASGMFNSMHAEHFQEPSVTANNNFLQKSSQDTKL